MCQVGHLSREVLERAQGGVRHGVEDHRHAVKDADGLGHVYASWVKYVGLGAGVAFFRCSGPKFVDLCGVVLF